MKPKKKKMIVVVISIVIIAALAICIGTKQMNSNGANTSDDKGKIEVVNEEKSDDDENQRLDNENSNGALDEEKSNGNSISSNTVIEIEGIQLPYAIPNTDLVVERLASYDGKYFEDGSDIDVSGIATIILTNTGNEEIEYTEVFLECDHQTLIFSASVIPSGESVVVQEKNRSSFEGGTCSTCYAEVATINEFEMSEEYVKIEENEDDSFSITNISSEDIPCVRVFYKLYMEDEDIYVGGITYNVKIIELKAGETRNVLPSHYANEYCKIVMVRTYDSVE